MTSPQGPLERQHQPRAWSAVGRASLAVSAASAWLLWTLIGALFAAGTLLLIARYAVLPRVDELRPWIERIAARALKVPVSIGRIEASWQGVNPHLVLSNVLVGGAGGQHGLVLPRVQGTLSWLSAVAFAPRFSLLRIEAPDLEVLRLPGDRFSVAGILLQPDAQPEDGGLADWMLVQGKTVITNARIRYSDQRVATAPTQFELANVNVQLEHHLGLHQLGLQAQPTATMAGPIDVRARFRHSPFAAPSDHTRWTGEVYGAVDYADLAALAALFGAPIKVERAEGAVRGWLTFERARVTRIVADVALTGVNVTLANDLEPLKLASLQGRISQRRWGDDNGSGGQEFTASRLALVEASQRSLAPIDFEVRTTRARGNADARTQVRASNVDLQSLSWLAAHVPLATNLREIVARHAVTGSLKNLTAAWPGYAPTPRNLTLKTEFHQITSAASPGAQADPQWPTFENLSGSIESSEGAGTLNLASTNAVVTFPGVFAEPRVRFATLKGAVRWTSDPVLELRINALAAANADFDIDAAGSYRAAASDAGTRGPGQLDLTGHIHRLDAPAAFRYMPSAAGTRTVGWMQHALIQGKLTDGIFRVKGDLAHFPFGGDRPGEMRLTARVADATLDVHPDPTRADRTDGPTRTWPLLTGIDAELLLDRSSLTVTAQRGSVYGVKLANVTARVPDLTRDATLELRGVAEGPLSDLLRYANVSPVSQWTSGVTNNAEATGPAKLNLQFSMPLQHAENTKVSGALQFAYNDIQLMGAPPFSRVTGILGFTESTVSSANLNAMMLGGQTKIDVTTRPDGGIVFAAGGIATVPALRRWTSLGPVQQLLDKSQGQARYTATLSVKPAVELKIDSDLVGVAIDGIAPLRKTAQETMPLRIERSVVAERDDVRVSAGRAFAVRLERRLERGEFQIMRGVIALNEAPNLPESGLLVLASVPRLDLQAWSAFLGSDDLTSPKPASVIAAPDISIDLLAVRTQELVVMGRTFRNVTLGASRMPDGGFDANVVSDGVAGYVAWRADQITARLSRLSIPAAAKGAVIEALHSSPRELPALDIAAEQFELSGMKLGRLDLLAQNVGAATAPAWRVRRFDVTNADMKLTASGEWAPAGGAAARRVKFTFKVDARDAGATLDRLGLSGAMAGGAGALEGDVGWFGTPLDIDYPTLSGTLALSLDNGRFLKVDTGKAARLLSLLSLQSLSRTLLFDGRQFSDGFAYNSIRADAAVAQGVLSTTNFRMAGATAAALMSGTIDLRNETQQLHLLVLPEIDASTAALALGVANPVLGLGAFVASYVLRNPLSKAFALEYDITGTWSQPNIARRGRPSAAAVSSTEAIR
ncbi:MAG: TIGR02099 family protein [Burkholderiaceae bacterium]|nr:TIGR02099 family protein [Burkholderiaceae bacterium]